MQKKRILGLLFVAIVAVFIAVPALQAVRGDIDNDPVFKRAKMETEIEAMRAEIKANGYSFTVGVNSCAPSMMIWCCPRCTSMTPASISKGSPAPNLYLLLISGMPLLLKTREAVEVAGLFPLSVY